MCDVIYLDEVRQRRRDVPDPLSSLMQFYGLAGEARLTVPIGPIGIYAEGSLGYGYISTNILESVDKQWLVQNNGSCNSKFSWISCTIKTCSVTFNSWTSSK